MSVGRNARSPANLAVEPFERLLREVRACTACDGMAYSHILGHASGRLDAPITFVAEAVGRRGGAVTGVPLTRDESGRRFAGFLDIAGIARADVFVTNAVLCNPLARDGRNRTPRAVEVVRCRPFLARTLALVRSPVVVSLGRVALEALRAIEPHRAELPRDAAMPVPWGGRTLVPMYHPSRQSTLHRAHADQEADWRRLGALLRASATPGRRLG
jgi:uracil-DNA glycosylase family 4